VRDLVEFMARGLVDKPEAVQVTETESDGTVVLEISVDADDVGKIIGKKGRIISSVRTVVKAAAIQEGKRVRVEVIS